VNPLVEPLLWFLAPIAVAVYCLAVIHITIKEPSMNIARYAKAIAAVIAGAITEYIVSSGFDVSQTVESAITVIITAIAVFIVPNSDKV
jgi:hypothetical protein